MIIDGADADSAGHPHIPIHHPEKIKELRPDYLLILPWNLKDEIIEQMSFIRTWGARFVVPIPEAQVIA
jgi:C-methyltransferase C-terminal domain